MVRAAVSLCGIELDNPVIPASGTFGYGYTFAELYDIDCLGTFSFKGTTREQRLGNAQPRIAEAPGGMLNAVGLQNPGVDALIAEELPRLKQVFHKPVMANVSGFSIEEYVEVCRKFDACEQVGWLYEQLFRRISRDKAQLRSTVRPQYLCRAFQGRPAYKYQKRRHIHRPKAYSSQGTEHRDDWKRKINKKPFLNGAAQFIY